ncbi:MAG: hypothetical protein ACO1QS_13400 [Verrucomicrobiota bacterium]
MKTSLKLLGLAALMLTACSSEDEASLTAPPASSAPQAAFDATSGVQTLPPVIAPSMAPPATTTGAAVPQPAATEAPASSALDNGTAHMNDEQRLTYALQLFYGDSSAPAITDFQPLVERKILARVPVAPAGKKYVIDLSKLEVRLENL